MSTPSSLLTRRDILRLACRDAGSRPLDRESAVTKTQNKEPFSLGPLQLWITDDTRRLEQAAKVEWQKASSSGADNEITLRPDVKLQPILGFGGALTDGACQIFQRMPQASRAHLFKQLFGPGGIGFNVCRICIGSSDCSSTVYSYDDGAVDPDLDRFSIAHDESCILPILRQVTELNSNMFLFASPWSPPGWMKSNGSMLGGCMRHTYMPAYADYFLRVLRAYDAAGIPIQAVTIQNEVDTDQDGTMPACAWPQDYEADFVTMHLGPLFQRAGVETKIWIIDHNYDLWGRAIGELETPDVRKYTNAIAWHGYSGEPELMARVQQAFPDVEMYWTEGGGDYKAPNYWSDWSEWGEKFTRVLRNGCRSLTLWTLASDQHGRPYVGGGANGIGGALIVNSETQEISYSGMFWALSHFSKVITRHATRIDSQSNAAGLTHCAFENPGGGLAVVITNAGPAKTCVLRVESQYARIEVPANSMLSLSTTPA